MMITDIVLMGLRELRDLIRTRATGNILIGNTLKCISAVDVFLEIERIKKRRRRTHVLRIIKEGESRFHEAVHKGYVQIAMLDDNAIQYGLFMSNDDFFTVQFWEPGVDRGTDPAHSARLVSLRSYDIICGTQFHLEIM